MVGSVLVRDWTIELTAVASCVFFYVLCPALTEISIKVRGTAEQKSS